MATEHTLTIRFEIYDGDVLEARFPMPETGIADVVKASIGDDGQWIVSGQEGNAHFTGRGGYRIEAILNYLRDRLLTGN